MVIRPEEVAAKGLHCEASLGDEGEKLFRTHCHGIVTELCRSVFKFPMELVSVASLF